MESYIVGLEPVPELDQNPAVTVLERLESCAAASCLLRGRSGPPVFEGAVHVYDSEAKARQVWRLFE